MQLGCLRLEKRKTIENTGRTYGTPSQPKKTARVLKKMRYQHSRSTIINAYVKPLLVAGIIMRKRARYLLTFYSKSFHGISKEFLLRDLLPIHSCCYEEVVLRELRTKPKNFNGLATCAHAGFFAKKREVMQQLRKKSSIEET